MTRLLAAVEAGLAVVLVVVSWSTAAWLGWSLLDALDTFLVTNGLMALSFGICGGILAWHRPRNPIGWLLATGGLLQALSTVGPPIGDA